MVTFKMQEEFYFFAKNFVPRVYLRIVEMTDVPEFCRQARRFSTGILTDFKENQRSLAAKGGYRRRFHSFQIHPTGQAPAFEGSFLHGPPKKLPGPPCRLCFSPKYVWKSHPAYGILLAV